MSSALRSSDVSSCGARVGAQDDGGCGSNVSDGVGAADDLAVAEVHAVERPDGEAPRAALGVLEACQVTFMRGSLRWASACPSRGSATAIGPPASDEQHRALRPPGIRDRPAVRRAARASSLVQAHRRHEAQRVGERRRRRRDRRRATSNGPIAVRRSSSQ